MDILLFSKNIFSPQAQTFWRRCFWMLLAIILYFTLTPDVVSGIEIPHLDKAFHFFAFVLFTFVFKMAYYRVHTLLIIAISCLLGLGIEILQLYIPGRSYSFLDLLADTMGTLAGFWLARFLYIQKTVNP